MGLDWGFRILPRRCDVRAGKALRVCLHHGIVRM